MEPIASWAVLQHVVYWGDLSLSPDLRTFPNPIPFLPVCLYGPKAQKEERKLAHMIIEQFYSKVLLLYTFVSLFFGGGGMDEIKSVSTQ